MYGSMYVCMYMYMEKKIVSQIYISIHLPYQLTWASPSVQVVSLSNP